mmetsp:Transcript_30809/g.60674  ORF Transcript_30809/g.60674 Transcript_30809/m.60674 type:complete len:205 (-) Transcript_30809:419-1033(-)
MSPVSLKFAAGCIVALQLRSGSMGVATVSGNPLLNDVPIRWAAEKPRPGGPYKKAPWKEEGPKKIDRWRSPENCHPASTFLKDPVSLAIAFSSKTGQNARRDARRLPSSRKTRHHLRLAYVSVMTVQGSSAVAAFSAQGLQGVTNRVSAFFGAEWSDSESCVCTGMKSSTTTNRHSFRPSDHKRTTHSPESARVSPKGKISLWR